MSEQTCPRRTNEFGPWEHKELLDRWRTEDLGPHKVRKCSFCGGLHPEDALMLFKLPGIEIIPTDKSYKLYIRDPLGRQAKIYNQHFSPEQAKTWNEIRREFHLDEDYVLRRLEKPRNE